MYSYLKRIVYDMLLKSRQLFRITRYLNVKIIAHFLALALLMVPSKAYRSRDAPSV